MKAFISEFRKKSNTNANLELLHYKIALSNIFLGLSNEEVKFLEAIFDKNYCHLHRDKDLSKLLNWTYRKYQHTKLSLLKKFNVKTLSGLVCVNLLDPEHFINTLTIRRKYLLMKKRQDKRRRVSYYAS